MQNYNEDMKFDMVKIDVRRTMEHQNGRKGNQIFICLKEVGVSLLLFPR